MRRYVEPGELVAVGAGYGSVALFLDRPVVTLPQGRLRNAANFREFIEVFEPAVVILLVWDLKFQRLLPQMGYRLEPVPALRGSRVFRKVEGS